MWNAGRSAPPDSIAMIWNTRQPPKKDLLVSGIYIVSESKHSSVSWTEQAT